MKFIGATSPIVIALFALASCAVSAADTPLPILQEPVLGLRYQANKVKFDAVPPVVFSMCPDLVTNRVGRRLWIYAFARDSASSYYVVGGYFIRHYPRPPDYPKYETDDLGAVLKLEGDRCTMIGPARQTFDVRSFDEIPSPILQQLSANLAARLARAFGGPGQLQIALRNQHVNQNRLPSELQEAFKPYFDPPN
jgi:hypothetical protein